MPSYNEKCGKIFMKPDRAQRATGKSRCVNGDNIKDRITHSMIFSFLLVAIMTLFSSQAFASGPTLGDAISNVVFSADLIPGLITAFAYLTGLVLGAMAIVKVKEHIDNPQQVPVWEPIKHFIAGGALFALPMVINAAYSTIAGGTIRAPFSLVGISQTDFQGSTSGSFGLDAMIVDLMRDIWLPMHALITGFAYLAGLLFIVVGIMRLLKSSQDGARGPGGIGTIFTFITAGVLFSLDQVMGAFSTSITGTTVVTNGVTFSSGSGTLGIGNALDPAAQDHVAAVISGVLSFMIIIGWISFVRGFFLLREFADSGGQSQNASLMAAITHIFGGAILVNLGPFMNMVQETLGLTPYGFIFT